ncbi:hydrogenobyrinic acid a,c-diamide synthase (glutamine-hydrolysing) /cobyrinate a,c-diamide synthase [Novosphingobium sp. CF614]|uniref:cobyrinate a,c-diamide synthase n=1 Tax=Novosphingobium sp. CF614 TaxID=1884364 RepID=UPI0008E65AA6|nr:cobyrinate a,c-diamide synthase [Novosphingobium sp. CF614]SFG01590.1 hydrogenobyrinic acid a,c-diamide synthase (glutamine-hydrolysing) /cobyrinate a,c-diamide synthase [Novosphingobium sp. CF614]
MSVPGLMIAAPASGTGKTTMMLGLLRALSEDGLTVQPFKSGPDYIDPAFHRAACGRASFNLDSWAMEGGLLDAIAAEAAGADMVLAEGSMGLYDGVAGIGASGNGASADMARRMGWPVVLVLDVSGQAQSAAATALGFRSLDPQLPFAGVILNRVASPRHERLVRQGLEAAGIPVLGALSRRGDLTLPERHLGLVQALEHPDLDRAIADYAAFLRAHADLDAIRGAAGGSEAAPQGDGRLPLPPAQRIAIARDAAFSFVYPHLLEGWRRAGAEILPFSPLVDEAPAAHADLVWLPGGYPELHAGTIAAATNFLSGLRRHAETRPVHGECGGYMVLGEGLIDKSGERHRMAGLLGLVTSHARRRMHLGYRLAELLVPVSGLAAGTRLRGHEFHYSTIVEQNDPPLARVTDADGAGVAETGSHRGHVTGTYFHMIAPVSRGAGR